MYESSLYYFLIALHMKLKGVDTYANRNISILMLGLGADLVVVGLVPSTHSKLELIHMDLCRPIRVESINGKKFIMVIVDDYSRYMWVYFLRIKDEAPVMIMKFIAQTNRFNVEDSSAESNETPSKADLDYLFGLIYEEYFKKRYPKCPLIHLHQQLFIMKTHLQDSANLDGNTLNTPFNPPVFEEAELSLTTQDSSNMHEFNQVYPSTHTWTKSHPLEQVIGDPSKPVMTRSRLNTDSEVCMYLLTVSTSKTENIKEAMLDHRWIKSMQDELH
ncbi:retrovirus-related pol polyprotein from transposon TNT 1-94 [Tanacetum coccineum]